MRRNPKSEGMKFCECGCGELTKWAPYKGSYNDFLEWHWCRIQSERVRKINSDWQKSRWASAVARKEQSVKISKSYTKDRCEEYSKTITERWKTDPRRRRWAQKPCECGCGILATPGRRFIWGHNKNTGFSRRHIAGSKLSLEAYQRRIEKLSKTGYSNNCKTKWFWSEKNRKNIYYHSSFELISFILLEKMDKVRSYERCPYVIDYELNGVSHKYIPDILITYVDNTQEVIEVKPNYQLKYEVNRVKIESAEKYFSGIGIPFTVWSEDRLKS